MSPIRIRLRELREAQGLTQRQLAEAAGMRQPTISDLENRTPQRLDLSVLERLADALGVDAALLVQHDHVHRRKDREGR